MKKLSISMASIILSTGVAFAANSAPNVPLNNVSVPHVTKPGTYNSGSIDISKLNTGGNSAVWNIQCQYNITGSSNVTAISLNETIPYIVGYPGTFLVNGTQYNNDGIQAKTGTISLNGIAPYPGYDGAVVLKNMDGTNDIELTSCQAILVQGLK